MSIFRKFALFAACASVFCLTGTANAVETKNLAQPSRNLIAQDFEMTKDGFASALVIDARTKKVLYAYEPDKVWTAASLTKLTGALVFVEKKLPWSRVVSIQSKDEVGGGRLRVKSGATMTVKDVLYSSLVGSANNAATALARLSGWGTKTFVQKMNAKAKALGCTNTVFTDPSGMDVGNQTTAQDLAKIAFAAFSNPEIRRAASTQAYSFKVINANEKKTIKNTNQLLLDDDNGLWVTGGKTGYLEESKNNLVVRLRPSSKDSQRELLVVVLGAETKQSLFDEAARLARWSWSAYDWSAQGLTAANTVK